LHNASISPKVLEPIRGQLGVVHSVLDILVPHPGLNGIRKRRIAANIAKLPERLKAVAVLDDDL
jgi:hypothetical protein